MTGIQAEQALARDEVVRRLQSFFDAHGAGIVAAYLFGSMAPGEARRTSERLALIETLAIQCMIDVALHVVSDERLGEPATLQDLFSVLARSGWVEPTLAPALARAAGFP